jgi:hypothetical protein
MCEKCAEIDKRIEHYERIVASINDQLTINPKSRSWKQCAGRSHESIIPGWDAVPAG